MSDASDRDCPDRAALYDYALGRESELRLAVAGHLKRSCPRCASVLRPLFEAMLGPARPAAEQQEVADLSLTAAIVRSRRALSAAAEARGAAFALVTRALEGGEISAWERHDAPLHLWSVCEVVLDLVADAPASPAAHPLAHLAVAVASEQRLELFPPERLADLRARAWGELGNVLRVGGDLVGAARALNRGLALRQEGSGSPLLAGRLLDLAGSLERARRRFPEARAALGRAVALYLAHGERHLAGRTLVTLGMTEGTAGDPEAAIASFGRALSLLDRRREPALVSAALNNLVYVFVDAGDLDAAHRLLWQARDLFRHASDVDRLRLLWVEARVTQSVGDRPRAERLFREVMHAFDGLGLVYDAALASLDLGMVLLEQELIGEVLELVTAAHYTFVRLEVDREACAALLLLLEALERGEAATELLAAAIADLRRAGPPPSRDPA